MKNTSLGHHTFAFFQKAKEDEFSLLTQDFIAYANKNNDMKRFPLSNNKGWQYIYKNNKGIRWLLLSSRQKNGFIIQGVMAVINPKALIGEGYITAAQEDDLEKVEKIFNNEAAKISPLLLNLGQCSLNRADPCLNIDLKELGFPCTPEQMMSLIKQGNVPRHYKERKEDYDVKQHRKVTDQYSFYLENKSCVINYYWKYPKQNEKHPNFLFRESSRNVIRLEVQCKYLKLYALSKNISQESRFCMSGEDMSLEELYERVVNDVKDPSIPMDVILSGKVCDNIIRKHFHKVLRKGDYFTFDGARSIVESYNFRQEKEDRILDTLELVNESHGIANAKAKLNRLDLNDFNRSLKDLDEMLVNPVTIPRRWNIKHISNLLRAYDDAVYEEELIPEQEYLARRHIAEYLER